MPMVTLKDIAERAGVSPSLVSKALHHHSKVSPRTIERVEAIARELGYHPNPILASFASKEHRSPSSVDHTPIVFLTDRKHDPRASLRESLSRYADQIGYALAEEDVSDFPSMGRIPDILYHRGVQGILIAQNMTEAVMEQADWSRFSLVMVGLGTATLPYSHVGVEYYGAVEEAWRQCWEAGYRRIGFAHIAHRHEGHYLDDHLRIGAFLMQQRKYLGPDAEGIPVHRFRREPSAVDAIGEWARTHQIDAMIAFTSVAFSLLRQAGFESPRDLGVVSLVPHGNTTHVAHFEGLHQRMCLEAVRLLDQKVRYGERGIPKAKVSIMLEPSFVPGATLPRKAAG